MKLFIAIGINVFGEDGELNFAQYRFILSDSEDLKTDRVFSAL